MKRLIEPGGEKGPWKLQAATETVKEAILK